VYGGVRAVVGVPNELVETVAPAEALTVPPPAAPVADKEPVQLSEDGKRPLLTRRRSPRHGATGPTPVPAVADTTAADSASAAPAKQQSPEQAGAWMGAFLNGDTGADERDNSAEQER